ALQSGSLASTDASSEDRHHLHTITERVQQRLEGYLDKQQEAILGPDLSDRRNVVDKILYTPAIQHAINIDSKENSRELAKSRNLARSYLNEIASDYSSATVRFFDRFLTWLWTQLYDGVEVAHFERVRELASDYEIIYVPCHRSHMDYLLLSYVIYKRGLRVPYVAAGENLNIPVLGQILRNGGAFFMRRSFKGNPLYSAVFREYVHSMLMRNTPIEYFIEGGRSRSGRLLPPKKGMLAMTVQSHLRQAGKPIVFIPTYIGYERIMEGGTYVGELKGKPKESESLLGLLKASRKIERIFGHVHVSFGQPLYLADFMKKFDVAPNTLPKDRTDSDMPANVTHMIDNLGIKIMQRINRSAVLNPVTLLSLVLLDTPHGALDEQSCREQLALYQRIAE
ncbi:MAG: 1-acyl-sn-glycerol-3-phosphate acyltransferase, partial [Moraxella osloensis]